MIAATCRLGKPSNRYQECCHSSLPPVSHESMAMKITQVFCSGMPYMNHLVSHTALPEAGASKNLPL